MRIIVIFAVITGAVFSLSDFGDFEDFIPEPLEDDTVPQVCCPLFVLFYCYAFRAPLRRPNLF
jgi:hypothetical protein